MRRLRAITSGGSRSTTAVVGRGLRELAHVVGLAGAIDGPLRGRAGVVAVGIGVGPEGRDAVEVVDGHGRRQLPLDRLRTPRVRARRNAREELRPDQVRDEDQIYAPRTNAETETQTFAPCR